MSDALGVHVRYPVHDLVKQAPGLVLTKLPLGNDLIKQFAS